MIMTIGHDPSAQLEVRLSALVPSGMVVRALPIDDHLGAIFAEERTLVERAVAKRQREFSTGRRCAHLCMEQLDVLPTPISMGDRGAPNLPVGYVGSLAHCVDVAVAVLAPRNACRSVGVDLEPDAPLNPKLARRICAPDEQHADELLRRVFCAKEAFYKWQFPLTGKYLGFHGARVGINGDRFRIEVLQPIGDLSIGFAIGGEFVTEGGILAALVT